MAATGRGCHPETTADIPMVSRKEGNVTNTTNSSIQLGRSVALPAANLAILLAALEDQSGLSESRRRDLSTPEQKCIGSPEQKYINDVGKKPPELGAFRQASGLVGMIRRCVRAGMA